MTLTTLIVAFILMQYGSGPIRGFAVTLFIGSAPKLAAFAMIMRVLVDGLTELHSDWQGMLVILAVLAAAHLLFLDREI